MKTLATDDAQIPSEGEKPSDTQPSTDGKPTHRGADSQPKSGLSGTASSVQTGDTIHLVWTVFILLAAVVIVFSLVSMKKKVLRESEAISIRSRTLSTAIRQTRSLPGNSLIRRLSMRKRILPNKS